MDGILDPRLSLVSTVEGAFGLGDYEHNSWGLFGGARFAPGEDRRAALDLDTRLVSVLSLSDGKRWSGRPSRRHRSVPCWQWC